jgi:UPF0271 protein
VVTNSTETAGVRRIDLNCDLGETPLPWHESDEPQLLQLLTSANVACGGHAGDEASMLAICKEAARLGVVVGAQVSYPDRENFGRVALAMPAAALAESIDGQFAALATAARACGTRVTYVKPHGALYNAVVHHRDHAEAVVQLAAKYRVALFGLTSSLTEQLALASDVPFVPEWFADRGYMGDGTLVPRTKPGALITSPSMVRERVLRVINDGTTLAVDGTVVTTPLCTICVHSDTPGAVELLSAVREALTVCGVQIANV